MLKRAMTSTDSNIHYRQAKWCFNSPAILSLLRTNLPKIYVEDRQVSIYSSAIDFLQG